MRRFKIVNIQPLAWLTPCLVLRLGKPFEHLQSALRAAQSTGDIKEQLMTISRQLGYFGYLTYDAVVWVCARRSRTTNMMNVFPSGQRYQIYYP